MGSSKQSTNSHETVDMGGFSPYKQPLADNISNLQGAYQGMKSSPLIGQAQANMSNVLSGNELDPANNPYLQKYAKQAAGDFSSQFNSVMSRAGRGNLTGGDAQQLYGRGLGQAVLPIYMRDFENQQARMDQEGRAAPAMTVAGAAPEEWLQSQLIAGAGTGQSGTRDTKSTTTSTPSFGQMLGGGIMSAIGLANGGMFGGAAGSMGGLGMNAYNTAPYGSLPWQTNMGGFGGIGSR